MQFADGGILRNSGALGNPIGNTMADSPGVLYPDFEVDSTPDLTVSNETNELMQDPVISQTMRNMLSNPQYLNQVILVLSVWTIFLLYFYTFFLKILSYLSVSYMYLRCLASTHGYRTCLIPILRLEI